MAIAPKRTPGTGAAVLGLLLSLWPNAARSGHAQPRPQEPADLVTRLERRFAERLAAVEERALQAESASRKLRSESRFLNAVNGAGLPPGPSRERVEALTREASLLRRIEVHLRRRFAAAIDCHLLHRSVLDEVDAAIARRRRLPRPSRGPLALRDRLLHRLLECADRLRPGCEAAAGSVEQEERALDAFRTRKKLAEETLLEAERAWAEEQTREANRRDRQKAALRAERRKLHEQWTRLVRAREVLDAERVEPARRLRRALAPAARSPSGANPLPPLEALRENARARAALSAAIKARNALSKLAAREREHLQAVAAFHRDWCRYLDACRREGVRLPVLPGLDAEESLRAGADAALAAREKTAEQAELTRENKRTRELIRLLEEEARAMERKRRGQADPGGLAFPPPRGARVLPLPQLPAEPTPALHEALAAARAAEDRRGGLQRELAGQRRKARALGRTAAEAAEAMAALDHDDPAFARTERAFLATRDALVDLHRCYAAGVEAYDASARELEARRAELARRIAAHRVQDRTAWRWRLKHVWLPRLREATRSLPATENLLGLAAGLLVVGLAAGSLKRPRALAAAARLTCTAALAVLAVTGMSRSGNSALALAGVGGIGVFALLWAVPSNLLAGLRLRMSGRGREGELIWNDRVKGRVLRRGLFRSMLEVESAEKPRRVNLGNRLLTRRGPPPPTIAAPMPSRPRASSGGGETELPAEGELYFHVTLDSDWMAVRQLVERVGRRHDESAVVHFRVEGERIRLVLALDPSGPLPHVREEVLRSLRAAPFARLASR